MIVNCAGAGVWRFIDEADPRDIISARNAPCLTAMAVLHTFLPVSLEIIFINLLMFGM